MICREDLQDPGRGASNPVFSRMGEERVQTAGTGQSQRRGLALMVVIPCLNEAPTVERVIAGIPKEIPGIERIHVVVVDDGALVTNVHPGKAIRADTR